MKMERSVAKRWYIKFRRRGITQKKVYKIPTVAVDKLRPTRLVKKI
jgi:hypothetical protein